MSILGKDFQTLLSRSGLVFACRISGAALVFLTQILLARWMGAAELGVYVYALSLAMLLSTIAALGFPAAALRFVSKYIEEQKTASINGFLKKGRQIIFVSSICVGAITFAILSVSLSPENNYYRPILIAIACIPFIALFRFHDRVAHAFSWFTLSSMPSMVVRPLLFLMALVVVWKLTSQLSASIAMVVQFGAVIVVVSVQYLLLRPRLKQAINNSQSEIELSVWLRSSLPLLLITIFTHFFPELTIIFIGADLPSDEIAIYNASYRTSLLIGFFYSAVCAALVPNVAQLHARGDVQGMQLYVVRATRLTFLLSLFGFLFFVFAGELFLGLFGEEFVVGYPALLILAASQLVLAAVGPVTILLNVTGYQNQCLLVFAVSIILTIVLEKLLVPDLGIVGAAILVFLVVVFWAIWLHQLVVRNLKIYPSIFSFIKV